MNSSAVKILGILQLVVLFVCSHLNGGLCVPRLISPDPAPPPPIARKSEPPPPPAVFTEAAVEGVVYCGSCRLPGYVKSFNAAPLRGAVAKIRCTIGKSIRAAEDVVTDVNGYFSVLISSITEREIKRCRVFIAGPKWCNKQILPEPKILGVLPKFERFIYFGREQFGLYSAGFFEFAPSNTNLCPHPP